MCKSDQDPTMHPNLTSKMVYVQPTTTTFEFMGPHGIIGTLIALPATVVGLSLICSASGCPSYQISNQQYIDLSSLCVYTAWVTCHILAALIVPGEVVEGTKLETNQKLKYKINGFNTLILCVLIGVSAGYVSGTGWMIWVADRYLQLSISGIIFASTLSLILYLYSFRSDQVLVAKVANSGYPLYDFWMGRELNPRLFGIDLKFVCELRPGLIGWMLLNGCLMVKQHATFGGISNSMFIVNIAQGYYVIDALWNEKAILTTMDITTDGFGFMLVFGDLVWVPFTYSLQARYLSLYPQVLTQLQVGAILLLNLIGLYIFRASNSQKNAFRTNPDSPAVAHLKYLKTESGSKLLISGWWGAARKINYTGDWLMSLAWCLPCGFHSIIPYFYCIYFAILLIHRAMRDDEMCHHKYGNDWLKYKKLVKYAFIPGIL